ncbi:type I restriction endonuclease subunit R [Lactiplantibacillus modestisalitolerans]|uniref:Type I restriction enzyme endonuclease subunit n=1 Tax=Lactiplantibacillus modestisalitolerans TaxID=1457219 RepID=A0ABV5WUZ1_9LACO|nr:type I restriction endonuclease subunit R [Lactiplantibacillus modestisalitolerans]
MARNVQSEAALEDEFIRRLRSIGYRFVKIPDVETLNNHFRELLSERNRERLGGVPLSNREFQSVMNELVGARTHYQVAQILRGSATQPVGKIEIKRDDESNLYLDLFDGRDFRNNIFEVSHQMTVMGLHENRYDVLVLINGLPIAEIELKRSDVEITQAFNQIIRYRSESFNYAKLMRLVQVFVVSNSNETRYFANGDGNLNSNFMFYWTDQANNRYNDLGIFTTAFFDKQRLHSLIAKYTIFDRTNQKMLLMRPYQIYATEAIIEQAKTHPHDNGYVWHTTGSGKTITSFKASQLLLRETNAEKVIFMIDRADLDLQTVKNFSAYLPETTSGQNPLDRIDNTEALVRQLASSDNGLIVTTIQKLNNAVSNDRYKATLTPYHDRRVIFIEDESHRSQFGEMRKNVNRWFKNAQHFGFTGTPIFPENVGQDGRTTADLYGKRLHQYLIKDAVRDGNVLGFSVQYLSTVSQKDGTVEDEQVPGIDTQEVWEDEDRVERVVQHILFNHNQITKQRHYNAILTVTNTRMALKYYRMFKKLDPKHDLKVTTIFTWEANELDNEAHQNDDAVTSRQGLDQVIADYNQLYGTDFSTNHFRSYFSDVSKRMKDHNDQTPEDNIDILIVVNMFLTGFDSKRLSTLYVDKNLQWHGLIQAFSRTNRVETDKKPFGNIIAYRNIKAKTDEAVALFSDGDSSGFLAPDYATLKPDFVDSIEKLLTIAPTVQSVDRLYDQGEEAQKEFVLAFRALLRLYNRIRVYDEFDWAQFEPRFSEQLLRDYQGRYYEAYQNVVKRQSAETVSVLDDIDFDISLIETDKITVDYIINLIAGIDTQSDEGRKRDIRKIERMLDNATTDSLKSKAELIRTFLEQQLPLLDADDDIGLSLSAFFAQSKQAAIEGFSRSHNLSVDFVNEQLADYAFYGKTNGGEVFQQLSGLSFHEKRRVKRELNDFIEELDPKYSLNS